MTSWVVFDDGDRRLSPLNDLRASFEIRTGAMTTLERLTAQLGTPASALMVPASLAEIVDARHSLPVNRLPQADRVTFVNGGISSVIISLPDEPNTALVGEDGQVLAACFDRQHAAAFAESGCRELPRGAATTQELSQPILGRPWEVFAHAAENLTGDLMLLSRRLRQLKSTAPYVTIVGEHPVLVGHGVTVHPHVVFDTSAGLIAIDDGAEVRSMSVIVGPGYIGRGTAIANHAHIRGRCVIGAVCKVGGEVNASLFQGHSNKAHSGYLGNSFVGEWVNLGADTVTSNLKNTYGEVRVTPWPGDKPQATGMNHLGSILGDHVKTAIGTKLLTGSIIHTGAMLAGAGFPPKCVPPFAFITDQGEAVYDFDKFCEVAQTMMSRREQTVSEALRRRLRELWEQSQASGIVNRSPGSGSGVARQ